MPELQQCITKTHWQNYITIYEMDWYYSWLKKRFCLLKIEKNSSMVYICRIRSKWPEMKSYTKWREMRLENCQFQHSVNDVSYSWRFINVWAPYIYDRPLIDLLALFDFVCMRVQQHLCSSWANRYLDSTLTISS